VVVIHRETMCVFCLTRNPRFNEVRLVGRSPKLGS
jgi:hypothetical protein